MNRVVPAAEITPFVDHLAARIASFPAHAVAAAKASVVRSDIDIVDQLLAEGAAFDATLGAAVTQDAMRRFIEIGGQTPEGERRLGELVGELGDPPGPPT